MPSSVIGILSGYIRYSRIPDKAFYALRQFALTVNFIFHPRQFYDEQTRSNFSCIFNSVVAYTLRANNQRLRTRSSSIVKISMLKIHLSHFFLMIFRRSHLQSAKQRHIAKIRSALNSVFPVRSTGASRSIGLHDE